MSEPGSGGQEKVVIRCAARLHKGYIDDPPWNAVDQLLKVPPDDPPKAFRIRHCESDEVEEIPTEGIVALLYVKTFEGNAEHVDLNFHSYVPTVDGIWMRITFLNGETMEGLVHNSLRYLVDPGFFLLPTDPESNNKLVYVMKIALRDHRVLGIRRLEPAEATLSRGIKG